MLLCQVRPPGHHAGVRQAMGFCLHNNAAVAALAAQSAGAKKVLIVDWVDYLAFIMSSVLVILLRLMNNMMTLSHMRRRCFCH